MIGASGDMADFQYIQADLDQLITDEFTFGDSGTHDLGPAEVHEYLSNVMYRRRSKIDPLWNSILVGGVKDGKRQVMFCWESCNLGLRYVFSESCDT